VAFLCGEENKFRAFDSGRRIFDLRAGGPQYGFDLQEVEQRGLDIVVAIDTSKSMLDDGHRAKPAGTCEARRAGIDANGRDGPHGPGCIPR